MSNIDKINTVKHNMNLTHPVRRILHYSVGNLNSLEGSSNNSINLCLLLSKLDNTYVHILLSRNINYNYFPKELLRVKNIKIHEPKHFNIGSINVTNYESIMINLDRQYNYKVIFIRTMLHLKQNIPLIKKSSFFIQYSNSRKDNIINQVNNIFFSNKLVMDYYLEKYKNNTKNIIEIFPMVRSIVECKKTLDKNTINICYLGTYKKDYMIKEFIEVLKNVNLKNINIYLHLYGDIFPKDCGLSKKLLIEISRNNKYINYYGKIENGDIENVLKRMHFGISIRSSKFNTHLDLSSKLVDYARHGVIPLCNETDINKYIVGPHFKGFIYKPDDIIKKIQEYINNEDSYYKDVESCIFGCKKLLHDEYLPKLEKYINNI